MPSVERLKQRLVQNIQARRIDAALGALSLLAREESDEPIWPRCAARLMRARSDTQGEWVALRRALELQVDRGLVLDAIATCKAILEIEPDDAGTFETLDLLYLEGPTRPASESPSEAGADDAGPPDTLVLTEVVPGVRVVQNADAFPVGEIPVDPLEGAGEESLDLCPDDGSWGEDLLDLMAAQTVSLPGQDTPGAIAGEPVSGHDADLRSELANIPLFRNLDPASLHSLIRQVREVSLEAGQVLFRQDDAANTLYVVVDGAVVPIAEGERRCKLAVLEHGDFFGEIGLMADQPRNATIEALVDTKLLAIDRRLVWRLIEAHPSIAEGIRGFLRPRLIDRQIRTHLLFSAFADTEREMVAKQFRFLEVDEGMSVVEQGRAPEGLFVVLSGALDVVRRAGPRSGEVDEVLGTLGLGDVFGGISLIDGQLPQVDVVAGSLCWLVVLGEGRFRRIREANPGLDGVLRRIAGATGWSRQRGSPLAF